jgi:TrpR-related protein YerC/YecD
MARRASPVHPRLRDPHVDQLCKAFLALHTIDECYRFLDDVCTITEIRALAARLEVARLLADGRTYDDIVQRTGASSATISRVRRFLEYGADGYRLVLARLGRSHS